ncbi:MAG: hypothetical protein COA67_05635 [Lutibacter sp.]|nr:MAG: hypothetical protein COA67_05635 [Lutibacter sp.]
MKKEYKIIQFETKPIAVRGKMESFMPNSKEWNKLNRICKTYVETKNLPGDIKIDIDENIFLKELNEPKIMRNCGLNTLNVRLKGKEFIETEIVKPAGRKVGKKIYPEIIKVSKKYILIESKKIENRNFLKIAKFKRLSALENEKSVQFYDIEFEDSELKII